MFEDDNIFVFLHYIIQIISDFSSKYCIRNNWNSTYKKDKPI